MFTTLLHLLLEPILFLSHIIVNFKSGRVDEHHTTKLLYDSPLQVLREQTPCS